MVRMSQLDRAELEYVSSFRWACRESPTEAHHWVQLGMSNTFKCKYCEEERKLIMNWGDMCKASHKAVSRANKSKGGN